MEVKPVTDILRCFCKSWNSAGNHFGNHFCDECFGSCGGASALVNPCYGTGAGRSHTHAGLLKMGRFPPCNPSAGNNNRKASVPVRESSELLVFAPK
ncbi:MAG: hypothetical protein IJP61_04615 [Treponema sp.]|nr:hypothetical protein [Treponema sp.]